MIRSFSRGSTKHAGELLAGTQSGKYSPIDVAQWLDNLATRIDGLLAMVGAPSSVETKRLAIDAGIQAGLASFFATKFRAGVLFAIHERTNDAQALKGALTNYRAAGGVGGLVGQRRGLRSRPCGERKNLRPGTLA